MILCIKGERGRSTSDVSQSIQFSHVAGEPSKKQWQRDFSFASQKLMAETALTPLLSIKQTSFGRSECPCARPGWCQTWCSLGIHSTASQISHPLRHMVCRISIKKNGKIPPPDKLACCAPTASTHSGFKNEQGCYTERAVCDVTKMAPVCSRMSREGFQSR